MRRSDEARREFASRMRGALAYAIGYTAPSGVTADEAVGDLWERLADLIDPTCHHVIEDETQVCSECGDDLDEGYGWDYCPHCGARVVDGDE